MNFFLSSCFLEIRGDNSTFIFVLCSPDNACDSGSMLAKASSFSLASQARSEALPCSDILFTIEDFEKQKDPGTYDQAKKVFDRYQEIMLAHYRSNCKAIPGAVETFQWCNANGIKVATDTGFHRVITEAIMDGLGWVRDGLVDLSVDVEHIPGEMGRPAPFMIFHAMVHLGIHSVHEVIKIGDTPADMLAGHNAGCRGIVGVLSGPRPVTDWGKYRHTHVIPSVADLPALIESEFS